MQPVYKYKPLDIQCRKRNKRENKTMQDNRVCFVKECCVHESKSCEESKRSFMIFLNILSDKKKINNKAIKF